MKTFIIAATLVAFAHSASANCPTNPEIDAAQAALLKQAHAAKNDLEAAPIRQQLWALWAKAPDQTAQELLDSGMSARASFDFVKAMDAFDRLVAYCPDYAEGYNQRAFVHFLREDFAKALPDLDLALERHPTHVAAISGKALTLMGLGRHGEAQEVLGQAVELNPWIPERGLLQKPTGEEL